MEGREPTVEIWSEGVRLLGADPGFGPVVARAGPVTDRRGDRSHFESLVRIIVYQQLAGKAAATIHGRFVDALDGTVAPAAVLEADPDALRAAGLSRNKFRAITALAENVANGSMPLDDLEVRGDAQVIERLTAVWGVGRWTAEMFLMFQLRRPDVWPVGDLGVRRGWSRVHGRAELPTPDELHRLGEAYRPWRSAVAWYCYRAVEVLPPVG